MFRGYKRFDTMKYAPHISFFVFIFLIVAIGVLTNSSSIGMLIGFVAAGVIQPEIILSGLLIGFLATGQKKLIAIAIVVAIVLSLIIVNINSSLGATLFTMEIILRCISILTWVYLANAVVLFRKKV